MARPKRSPELKRQYHIGIRLDESEYGKVKDESDKIGVTLSAYVRAKIMRGFIRVPKYAKIETRQVNELSKLGGLFKKTHTESNGLYSERTAAILDEICLILTEVRKGFEDDRQAHS
ncbi:hypothetical protein AGMMS49957_01660 [Synergistales bacterium]|nr:hypothetical protein AGMMS49957_01660 [Synergistales bacterium]